MSAWSARVSVAMKRNETVQWASGSRAYLTCVMMERFDGNEGDNNVPPESGVDANEKRPIKKKIKGGKFYFFCDAFYSGVSTCSSSGTQPRVAVFFHRKHTGEEM
ncbi:hypothetical protein PR048_019940 [Dryococelus australis]|uniref:Uncharacterized protein n=1 Tax=Dryococelus australis TaxID=614101 RepID=A0ABQ9H4W7_9NEOP|nr:hypothetical protein PR048_019940 [Dryococelus australis]